MLSIGRLGRAQEDYYLERVAHGAEDYYTLAGEPAGHWIGDGAAVLGLAGAVGDEELRRLLGGQDPHTGAPLVARAAHPRRRPGFDLTFSAPKGVSLLALLGPEHARAAAMAAHRDAVLQALGYLERHAAWVRRGHGGGAYERAGGFAAAAFLHRSSRAGDPQLHTHVLVANVAFGSDGRASALFGRALYAEARTAGFLYQAALRYRLTRSLGLAWRAAVHGLAEPAGIDAGVLTAFSTRRAHIERSLTERGASSARAAQVAAYRTRAPKDVLLAPRDLRSAWRAHAEAIGFDLAALANLIGAERPMGFRTEHHFDVLLGSGGLTATVSSFDRRAVLRALAERARMGAPVAELERGADALLARPEVVELVALPGVPEGRRFSTQGLLALEAGLVARAAARGATPLGIVADATIASVLAARPALDDEQRQLVRALLGRGTPVAVVVGAAGTGKTYALEAARAGWGAAGHAVLGTALAARAAAELASGTGMAATTLARLLADAEAPGGALRSRSIVVVDEAGMVGTRTLARLFAIAERDAAKLVLVGDPRQLPELEAGGVLGALARRVGAIELAGNRRQAAAWERAVLAELRAGDVGIAVEAYAAHGRLTYADSAPGARQAMVARWVEARAAGANALMLALRRADVDELNARARVALRAGGHLGADELVVAGRGYASGDEVLACRNDRRLGLVNGTRGVVAAIDADVGALSVVLADGRSVAVPAAYLEAGHLTHAYALTIHKAQGATVERAFVLGSDALYREAGYVALSRARGRTDLFVVAGAANPDSVHERGARGQTEAVGELLWALRRSRAQELALDGLEREHEPGRDRRERGIEPGRAR